MKWLAATYDMLVPSYACFVPSYDMLVPSYDMLVPSYDMLVPSYHMLATPYHMLVSLKDLLFPSICVACSPDANSVCYISNADDTNYTVCLHYTTDIPYMI